MRITSTAADVTLAALRALLQHKSGVFVVRIHNYQVVEVAPIERGLSAADFAALIGAH